MDFNRRNLVMARAVSAVAAAALLALTGASGIGQEVQGAVTRALFDLDSPDRAPFPSDWFTIPDETNNTNRRVSLPLPDCDTYVSDCQDVDVLNGLDGFNLQPRISVPFSGDIDPTTVTSETVFLVSLGSTVPGQDEMLRGKVVGIDQVVWDTLTNTLHVESDALLAQHTRFALIVTRGIRDGKGRPIQASSAFRGFRANVPEFNDVPALGPNLRGAYQAALCEAIDVAGEHGVPEGEIAAASVFTTQSATAVLEKIRDQIHAATVEPADFILGQSGERTVFNLNDVTTNIIWKQQTGVNPDAFTTTQVDLSLLRTIYPGSVGRIAFGRYSSPDYEVHPGEYIPPVGTRTGEPAALATNTIYFNLFLPSGTKPAGGWPVAIFGHGINGNKNVAPLSVVSSLAQQGVATIAINMAGHGLGLRGTLSVNRSGQIVTFFAGGRGIDQNGDHRIDTSEGLNAAGPRSAVFASDGFRQTAADLMRLVRVIGAGVDADGDGQADVDASRIYYFGHSYGAAMGSLFLAVEPQVRAGVLSAPADPIPIGNLGLTFRFVVGSLLASRQPSLLNAPGVTMLDGRALAQAPAGPTFYYDDNTPLREQIPLTVTLQDSTTRVIQSPTPNSITGAMAIQTVLDRGEWIGQAGSPAAYAPHLRKAPLSGVPAKPMLYLIAKGDETAPNPTTTAILRAGDLADRTVFYRHDLYYGQFGGSSPTLRNPHGFATNVSNAFFRPIALGVQQMAATFFASDGGPVTVPGNLSQFLEFPIPSLPEDLNFVK